MMLSVSVVAPVATVVSNPNQTVSTFADVVFDVPAGTNESLGGYEATLLVDPGDGGVDITGADFAANSVLPDQSADLPPGEESLVVLVNNDVNDPPTGHTVDKLNVSGLLFEINPGDPTELPINDGTGLFRLLVDLAPGTEGSFAMRLTGLTLLDGSEPPQQISATTVDGTLNVVAGSLDIDGNGIADALTDGILAVRHMFMFSGTALVDGAIGTGATRTTGTEVGDFLTAIEDVVLDVDGNGMVDALTDGILLERYLFGFTGNALIDNAIGAGAARTTASQIIAFLDSWQPAGPAPATAPAALSAPPPTDTASADPQPARFGSALSWSVDAAAPTPAAVTPLVNLATDSPWLRRRNRFSLASTQDSLAAGQNQSDLLVDQA